MNSNAKRITIDITVAFDAEADEAAIARWSHLAANEQESPPEFYGRVTAACRDVVGTGYEIVLVDGWVGRPHLAGHSGHVGGNGMPPL